jgi:hypothetical protein
MTVICMVFGGMQKILVPVSHGSLAIDLVDSKQGAVRTNTTEYTSSKFQELMQ